MSFKPGRVAHPSTSSAYDGPSGLALEVKRYGKSTRYPYRLSFYDQRPSEDLTLEEFEDFAIARLRIIALIESARIRNLTPVQFKTLYDTASKKYLPLGANSAKGVDLDSERKRDIGSHFVLRLAFCGSEELRKRFARAETQLFRLRYESEDSEDRQAFLRSLELDWTIVSSEEKAEMSSQLMAVHTKMMDPKTFDAETFYKVPWTLVPDLVEKRRVVVSKGMAYVPRENQLSLVMQAFAERLERGLELTAKYLPRLDEDSRLLPILSHLSLSYLNGSTSTEYDPNANSDGSERVTAEMVDHLAPRHFPPCMRALWETGKANKHLKHYARLQLGLFLKGVGLSIEDALLWWRRLFGVGTGKMTEDHFKKEYQYNIRHSFGLEGAKKNYPPKNCQRILIQDQPGPQDSHGCPFRHFGPDRLTTFLQTSYGLSGPDLQEIQTQVKSQHYHVACTRVFEITHSEERMAAMVKGSKGESAGGNGVIVGVKKGEGVGGGESVDHPNRYFDRSWELEKLARGELSGGDRGSNAGPTGQEMDQS